MFRILYYKLVRLSKNFVHSVTTENEAPPQLCCEELAPDRLKRIFQGNIHILIC